MNKALRFATAASSAPITTGWLLALVLWYQHFLSTLPHALGGVGTTLDIYTHAINRDNLVVRGFR